MREDVHARGVHPAEKGLAGLDLTAHVVDGGRGGVVNGFHALLRKGPGIFDNLLADTTPMRVLRGVVFLASLATQNAARGILCHVFFVILWPILALWLFLGIEVIEVAEELIESVHCWEIVVSVSKMVLAELARRVAE